MAHALSGRAETPTQSRILSYVRDEGPLSRMDLASRLNVSRTTVAAEVGRLVELGATSMRVAVTDGRLGVLARGSSPSDIPWERCFRMLNTIGYEGPISVEWEDAGMDRLRGAPEALEFVRSLAFDPPASSFDSAFSASD